ncbi:hypothetical protein UA75_31085 (plasmid) [Actinoalloteichus sp. GBA129-24]|nr:hypothetical protein UA75_31085 [Actinoalloteichus sp. GBA129-24]
MLPQTGAAAQGTLIRDNPAKESAMNGQEFFDNLEQTFRDHDRQRRAEIRKARRAAAPAAEETDAEQPDPRKDVPPAD